MDDSAPRRLHRDVLWNLASLGVLGVSGILFNLVIARWANFDALGVFNQVFAIYIFASQLSVGGIHFSVLRAVSHRQDDVRSSARLVRAGLVLAGAIALGVGAVVAALHGLVGRILDSPDVAFGVLLVAPGLVFFALNKVLLNALNGARHMRAYAVYQALRPVLILAAIVGLIAAGAPGRAFAGALTAAEVALCLVLLVDVHVRVVPLVGAAPPDDTPWMREHFSFGARGLFSGVLGELNTRVDVLMLGIFYDDLLVGVYSFAAVLAEGASQVAMVVRRNVDPILGTAFAKGDLSGVPAFARSIRRKVYPFMLVVTIAAIAAFPFVFDLIADAPLIEAGYRRLASIVFALLMLGILVNAGYRPFLGITLQGGRPGMHTVLIGMLVGANIVLNAAFIPAARAIEHDAGLLGAAAATALVFILEAVLIVVFARRLFGVRL